MAYRYEDIVQALAEPLPQAPGYTPPIDPVTTGPQVDALRERGSWRPGVEAAGQFLDQNVMPYVGPHAQQALTNAAGVAEMVTPKFGTQEGAEAGHQINEGHYGKAATTLGFGTAGAMLDMIPGEAAVKGVLGAIKKGAQMVPNEAIFAGMAAKTADHGALARAREMASAGSPSEEIRQGTGWFQGADKQWRFEIPDNTAALKSESYRKDLTPQGGYLLGDVYNHPELFAAYPELKKVALSGYAPEGAHGASWQGNVGVSPKTPSGDPFYNTLTHELQHQVQDIEGFSRGGDSSLFRRSPEDLAQLKAMQDRLWTAQALQKEMAAGHSLDSTIPLYKELGIEVGPEHIDLAKTIDPTVMGQTGEAIQRQLTVADQGGYRGYYNLAGETEARESELRRKWTPEERQQVAPYDPTFSSAPPVQDQIIRLLSGR